MTLRCDFCSAPNPKPLWRYRARSFEVDHLKVGITDLHLASEADWAACKDCKAAIDQGLEAMMRDVPKRLGQNTGGPLPYVVLDHLRVLWTQFLVNRLGEPTRER